MSDQIIPRMTDWYRHKENKSMVIIRKADSITTVVRSLVEPSTEFDDFIEIPTSKILKEYELVTYDMIMKEKQVIWLIKEREAKVKELTDFGNQLSLASNGWSLESEIEKFLNKSSQ